MTDSKFDRMVREERDRWLKSRGDAGGSFAEFKAHIGRLVRTDDAWAAAFVEHVADEVWADRKLPKQLPIDENERQVHPEFATVRDLIRHADLMQKRAKTKAERAAADAMMMAAETARERAGGKLDTPLRYIRDKFWPARETRQ